MGCCGSKRKEEKDPLLKNNYHAESNKGKAVKDYIAKNNTEITFTVGQLIDIIDKTQKGYWMGQVEGQTGFGWFPSVCVVIIDEKEAIFEMEKRRLAKEQSTKGLLNSEVKAPSQRKSMTVNASGKVLKATAVRNYNPNLGDPTPQHEQPTTSASAISFTKGDVIIITDRAKSDWWLGHIEGSTNWGWFPADYVTVD